MNEDKKIVFQVPGSIIKAELKPISKKILYETQENIPPEHLQKLVTLVDCNSWMTISSHLIQPEDIINLPPIKTNGNGKSKSQRLRGVLYYLWQKNNEGFNDPEGHYNYYMEKFIDHIKSKLDNL